MGILCLIILFGLKLLKDKFPHVTWFKFLISNFIVVVIGILVSYFLNLKRAGVAILGDIPNAFLTPTAPSLDIASITDNFADAAVIAIIGFVESIVAAKILATKHGYQVSPNRELVALGSVNIIGSFFLELSFIWKLNAYCSCRSTWCSFSNILYSCIVFCAYYTFILNARFLLSP
jgi:MFS superfamily sulfate permease-like transporter